MLGFAFLYLLLEALCPLQTTALNLQNQWTNPKQILVFIL